MGNSLAKRIFLYTVLIALVVGVAAGLTWAFTDVTNSDYEIPKGAQEVREERYDVVIKVVDEEDRPLSVARIKANWSHDPNQRTKYSQLFSNNDGLAYLNLFGDDFYYFTLEIRARGYQTLYRTWGDRRTVDKKVELPEEIVIKLPRGETIGGTVVTQLGEPVVGAKVELYSDSEKLDDGEYYSRLQESTPTNAEGKWELTNAPPEMEDLRIKVSHSSHLKRDNWNRISKKSD